MAVRISTNSVMLTPSNSSAHNIFFTYAYASRLWCAQLKYAFIKVARPKTLFSILEIYFGFSIVKSYVTTIIRSEKVCVEPIKLKWKSPADRIDTFTQIAFRPVSP